MSRRQIAWAVVLGILPTLATYRAWGPWALLLGLFVASVYLILTSPQLRRVVRRVTPGPVRSPATLPPASPEELHARAQQGIWGDRRYRATSTWNDTERQAFLHLYLRDEVASQHYRVRVFDPAGVRSEVEAGQIVVGGSITELYPTAFRNAPPILAGEYTTVWYALVSKDGELSLEEIARDTFTVPRPEAAG